jgi:DNA-binding Xre family transcriptional regulator
MSKKGIRRDFLAKQLHVTYGTLWKIVSGAMKRIDPALLRKMAEVLDCRTDDLLYPPPQDGGETSSA